MADNDNTTFHAASEKHVYQVIGFDVGIAKSDAGEEAVCVNVLALDRSPIILILSQRAANDLARMLLGEKIQ
jgi:hypothetical protein